MSPDPSRFSDRSFPRCCRLATTDEFSSVFSLRNILKSRNFFLYYRRRGELPDIAADVAYPAGNEGSGESEKVVATEMPARLGVVVAKRLVSSAVRRNLLKRLARENFRLLRGNLCGYDLVLRLAAKPRSFERRALAEEIRGLLGRLRCRKNGEAGVKASEGGAVRAEKMTGAMR